MDMQALIEEMSALMTKIKSGTATLGELEAFAAAAQQVNERAIILRYKAIEAKVYGDETTPEIKPQTELIPELEMEHTLESSIITEQPTNTSFEFDLFGSNEEETLEEEISIENESSVFETEIEAEVKVEVEAMEESVSETELDSVFESEPEKSESSFIAPTPISHEKEHPIYTKLNPNDTSLAARLMAVRIDSLSSAFGFNERMQIIQELFDGSNDAFNSTIKTLDEMNSKNEARSIVSQTAHDYNWDIENLLALEFVQKVERRYA